MDCFATNAKLGFLEGIVRNGKTIRHVTRILIPLQLLVCIPLGRPRFNFGCYISQRGKLF